MAHQEHAMGQDCGMYIDIEVIPILQIPQTKNVSPNYERRSTIVKARGVHQKSMSKQKRTSCEDDRMAVARAAKFNVGGKMSAQPVRANDYGV